MKRNWAFSILVLLVAVVFVSGCAKDKGSVLQEEKVGAKESPTMEQAARDVKAEEVAKTAEVAKAEEAVKAGKAKEAVKAEAEKTMKPAAAAEATTKAKAAEKTGVTAAPAKDLYEFADIHFDYDKFSLNEGDRDILKKHTDWLNKNKEMMIVVECHCDERGTAEYNLALGERRANAAAKFLVDLGIDANKVKTISYGKELPLDPGHNEEAWTKNRRAHFVASSKK